MAANLRADTENGRKVGTSGFVGNLGIFSTTAKTPVIRMEEVTLPITERPNRISEDIDKANTTEIVSQLRQCDEEIFDGWRDFKGIHSRKIQATLKRVIRVASECVARGSIDKNAVILSGCGTSGRIAFLISRAFNELARKQNLAPCYRYICAGGDQSLMRSVETFEDDWNAGKEALVQEAEGLSKVLFVGITCGLSAPFVGGQLDYCLKHLDKFTPVMLGFNPVDLARNAPVKGTQKVLRDTAREMEEKGWLLNPVLGPEPITGSSRMKGGTATKMILESIFFAAHGQAVGKTTKAVHEQVINLYRMTVEHTYSKHDEIAKLVELAGTSLSTTGGTVTYLGWGSLGIMGMIDAAECVPTFGANHEDIRCFINGGYQILRNKEGDLSAQDDGSNIGFDHFKEKRCPTLSQKDTVIFIFRSLSTDDKVVLRSMAKLVKAQRCSVALIGITTNENESKQFLEVMNILGRPVSVHICLPASILSDNFTGSVECQKFLTQCSVEVSLKLVINAVSTGAHIIKGKVLKNYMIDLKLTNRKLFERAVSIVSLFGKVSSSYAKECLLKSIYRKDRLPTALPKADVSQHVKQAHLVSKVVPVALLMTTGRFTLASALKMLESCPIVRRCIDKNV